MGGWRDTPLPCVLEWARAAGPHLRLRLRLTLVVVCRRCACAAGRPSSECEICAKLACNACLQAQPRFVVPPQKVSAGVFCPSPTRKCRADRRSMRVSEAVKQRKRSDGRPPAAIRVCAHSLIVPAASLSWQLPLSHTPELHPLELCCALLLPLALALAPALACSGWLGPRGAAPALGVQSHKQAIKGAPGRGLLTA